MRSFFYGITVVVVIALAFWAYHENYRTQDALSRSAEVQREIGAARARLARLNTEWAFLNRPDRLRELTDLNFERLGLLPLERHQFGTVEHVTYPPDPFVELDGAVDVAERGAEDEEQKP